jgi:O-antigen/teichoic acid export membrane protein
VLLAFTPQIFAHAGVRADGLDRNVEVRELTENGLQLLIILGVPLVVFSFLLKRELVSLILGTSYQPAAAVLPVVVAGILCWQFAQFYQKGFETSARTRIIGSSIVWAVAVNLMMNIVLVPRWGIMGAAVATIGAYLCYLVLVAIRVEAFGRPKIRTRTIANVLFSASISCLVCLFGLGWLPGVSLRLAWAAISGLGYLLVLSFCSEPLLASQVRRIRLALDLR